jgi:hypothetical protein
MRARSSPREVASIARSVQTDGSAQGLGDCAYRSRARARGRDLALEAVTARLAPPPPRPRTSMALLTAPLRSRTHARDEASLETFISFRISLAFSFHDLRNWTQTLLTDLGRTSHGASGCGRRGILACPHTQLRPLLTSRLALASRTSLGESGIHRSFASRECSDSVPLARDFAPPSAVSARRGRLHA